jgi:hypothetical protein
VVTDGTLTLDVSSKREEVGDVCSTEPPSAATASAEGPSIAGEACVNEASTNDGSWPQLDKADKKPSNTKKYLMMTSPLKSLTKNGRLQIYHHRTHVSRRGVCYEDFRKLKKKIFVSLFR